VIGPRPRPSLARVALVATLALPALPAVAQPSADLPAAPVPQPSAATPTAPVPQPSADLPTAARPLGRLEQESVDEAMLGLGLRVDPLPAGKTIRAIHVVNQKVFSKGDWWFQFFNLFHRTTRPEMLARELLMKPGDRYDPDLVEETIRNLQVSKQTVGSTTFVPPELSSVVAIIPIASPVPGTVDLLVVTRDVWSLRLNSNFQTVGSTLTLLQASLSENNLLGWRKYLSLDFALDQGSTAVGPAYFDPNVLGTRLTLLAEARLTYARDTGDYEGNAELFSLRYPLYALASKWGGGIDAGHSNLVVRSFQGTHLRLEDLAATTDVVELLPYIFRRQVTTVDTNAVRSFGQAVIQRVTFGFLFDTRRSLLVPGFPATPQDGQLFLDEFAPLTEQRGEPYVRYDMFTARYALYRSLDTFDLRENRRLGPSLSLRVGADVPALGSSFGAFVVGGTISWAEGFGGSYEQLSLQVSGRRRDDGWIDEHLKGVAYLASPIVRRLGRVVLSAQTEAVRNDTGNTLYFLGGSTGLRGYEIGDFQGTAYVVAHAEIRSLALPLFSQRFGALAFYDVGDAADSFAALVIHQDLGFGLRWLIPQLNSSVIRFDWAFPLEDGNLTRAGWPGRFSAGFEQVFSNWP
jgi:hypothetical protein